MSSNETQKENDGYIAPVGTTQVNPLSFLFETSPF